MSIHGLIFRRLKSAFADKNASFVFADNFFYFEFRRLIFGVERRFAVVFRIVARQIPVRQERLIATVALERAFPVVFVVMMALVDVVFRESGARLAVRVVPYHF